MHKTYYQIKGYRDAIDVLCQSDGFPLTFDDIRSFIRIDRPQKKYYSLSISNNYKVFSHFQSIEGRDGAYLSITLLVPFDKRVSPSGIITSELHALEIMMKQFEDLYLDEDFEIKKIHINSGVFEKTIENINLETDSPHLIFKSQKNKKFGLIKYGKINQVKQVFQNPFFREMSNFQEVFFMSSDILASYPFPSLEVIADPSCFHPSYNLKIQFQDRNGDNLSDNKIQQLTLNVKINGISVTFQNDYHVFGLKDGDELKVNIISDRWELNSSGYIKFNSSDPALLGLEDASNRRLEIYSKDATGKSPRIFIISLIPKEYKKKFRIIDKNNAPLADVSVELINPSTAGNIERKYTNSQGYTDDFILHLQNAPYEFEIKKEEYELESDRLSIQDIKLQSTREIILSPKKYEVVLSLLNSPRKIKKDTSFIVKDKSGKVIHKSFSFDSKRTFKMMLPQGTYSIFLNDSKELLDSFAVEKSNKKVNFSIPNKKNGVGLSPKIQYYGVRVVIFLAILVMAISIYQYRNDIMSVGKNIHSKFTSLFSNGEENSSSNGKGVIRETEITEMSPEGTSGLDNIINDLQSTLESIIDFANSDNFALSEIQNEKLKLNNIPENHREKLNYNRLLHGSNPFLNANYGKLSKRLSDMKNIAGVIHELDGNHNKTTNEYCKLYNFYSSFKLSKDQNNYIESKFMIEGGSSFLDDTWNDWRDSNCN